MGTVITVENLGKKYLLKHQSAKQPYVALRDVLSDGVRNIGRKLLGRGNSVPCSAENEEFWALKDVCFEVNQGDLIGIIGRNGAGKSTLLKILSRITEPTTGSVRIKGRVASLLEVGTGFHPELTGRENVFLNGAILGMSREEIKRKFDEIVSFAEVERFLDTPVKRYSSGMYVRLAFAVAAHLEPEILIIDEVLAVGDSQFQKKCLGKMEDVSAKEGRTVLFVSHNMNAVHRLCQKAILLSAGQIVCRGEAENVIPSYLHGADTGIRARSDRSGSEGGANFITQVSIHDQTGSLIDRPLTVDEPFSVRFCYELDIFLPSAYATLEIKNRYGEYVLFSDNRDNRDSACLEEPGVSTVSIDIPAPLLVPGRYFVSVSIATPLTGTVDEYIDAAIIEIEDVTGIRTIRQGYIYIPLKWQRDATTRQ